MPPRLTFLQSLLDFAMRTLLIFSLYMLIGYSASASEAVMGNMYCPVTPSDRVEEDISVEYEGRTIYFCCKSCLRDFNKDPEEYLANLPVAISETEVTHEHENGDHEHDHASHSRGSSFLVGLLGKLHVAFVHFPIALIPFAALLATVGKFTGRSSLEMTAEFTLWAGALSALVAATMGWIAATQSNYPDNLDSILFAHRWGGSALAGFAILFAVLIGKQRNPVVRLVMLWGLSGIVLVVGHLGGSLVYGVDYLF